MAGTVVLAIRIGPESEAPTRVAARLARELGGDLVIVYVAVELGTAAMVATGAALDEDSVRRSIHERAQREVSTYIDGLLPGQAFQLEVIEGEVAESIAAVATKRKADFLVVGTKGRGALSRLVLGDTTNDILKRTPCPVVVVPRNVQT
jgi:nucleotide-binding universal stress UspA family protein